VKFLIPLISAVTLVAGCAAVQSHKVEVLSLSEGWVLEGFESPESVIADGKGGYFVSNVNGGGRDKDGNGFISRISANGEMLERIWADGVDAPKGMAIWDDTLYVADIDTLVMFDVNTGDITGRITVADASFLNDVATNYKGVFVSDSDQARIHKLNGDTLPVWLANERFERINGLLPQNDRVLVVTMGAGELLSVDWESLAITGLAAGMKNGDGLAERNDGSFMVSSFPGQLWHVRAGEAPKLLLDTSGDNGISHNDTLFEQSRVISPNWSSGTVREYNIIVGE
jgi:hypothetical protein